MDSYLESGPEGNPRPEKKKKRGGGYEFEGENGFAEFGGYMDAKISKLDQQYQAGRDLALQESNLFAGISIFVNGLTNPSSGELKLIMMRHGGTYHTYERSHTDYIIASNLPDVKIRNHTTKMIVKPEWITKCLEEKRIVDYAPYLLVTKRDHQQPKITFPGNQSVKQPVASPSIDGDHSKFQDIPTEVRTLRSSTSTLDVKEKKDIPAKNQAMTANDPSFLSEFYNNSRLHHISTLGATFKQHISELREAHSGDFPDRQVLLKDLNPTIDKLAAGEDSSTYIMHIDMDCFFVSVGLRNRPELIGQPIAVTHSKGNTVQVRPGADLNYENKAFRERFGEKFGGSTDSLGNADRTQSLSEIASCSYEARATGIKNGMFVGAALKLCPNLKTIPYDFDGYKEVAFTLYNTISKYTLDIEAVSCDEMYVDLSSLLRETGIPVLDFVTYVRNEIKSQTGCSCSAGVGANRIQARMATKRAKPNGQFHLLPEEVSEYFRNISINDLPGVGRSTAFKLEKKNWRTCGDLQQVPVSLMQQELGKKLGETIHHLAFGRDDKPLNFGQGRKSVSAEVNYGIRFNATSELEIFLSQLCIEVESRLKEAKRKGKCVTLKYMVRAEDAPVETAKFMGHGICDVVNKSMNLSEFTSDAETIKKAVLQLNWEMKIAPKELRGIGIQVTKLDAPEGKEEFRSSRLMEMFKKGQQLNQEKKKCEGTTVTVPDKERVVVQPRASVSPQKAKSPAKRGRPPKASKVIKTKPIAELLRPSANDFDQDVVNELPEEFRDEAIRSHRLMKRFNSALKLPLVDNEKQKDPPQSVAVVPTEVDDEFLAALPPDIREEIELEMGLRRDRLSVEDTQKGKSPAKEDKKEEPNQNLSPQNIFLSSDWKEVLYAWIAASEDPDEIDIKVVLDFWKELVHANLMVEVYSQFRFFHRNITSVSKCTWHKVYSRMAGEVQAVFLSKRGRKLAIKDQIDCAKCSYA